MPAPQTARQLLETEPGVGLCDACLALACDTSLTAMRKITAGLVAQTGGFRRGSTCESCGRVVASTLYARSTTTMLGLPDTCPGRPDTRAAPHSLSSADADDRRRA